MSHNAEPKPSKSALGESLALSLAIMNSMSEQIAVLDRQGVILAVNESWRRFSIDNSTDPGQTSAHNQVGTNYLSVCRRSVVRELPAADEALSAIKGITSVLDGRLAAFNLEYTCHSPAKNRWFNMRVVPLDMADGGVVITHADITERKQAEAALLKAGALQKAIFDSANFSSIATDAKGVIQIFNVGAERMLGYAAAEVMNKITPADISDPQELITHAKSLSAELDTAITPGFDALVFKASRGIEDIYELTYIRKDGSRFPAVVSVTALRDAQDIIIGYLLIGTDNTARKQAEAALALEVSNRAATERIKNDWLRLQSAALDACANALLIVGVDGVFQWVNPAFCQLSGYDASEVVGRSPNELVKYGAQDEAFYQNLWDTVLSGKPWKGELVNRHKNGTQYFEKMSITPVGGAQGQLTHLIVVKEDITEHKRIEAAAHAANHAKSEFLAAMSHEIRTPLGGLLGSLELLSFSKLDHEQVAVLQLAHSAGSSLLRILNDILDFSKIDQGKLELSQQPVSIAALVAEVVNTYSHMASANSVTLTHWVDSRLSQAHMVDPLRLSQVLNNFVSNAIKFNHGSKVGIRAELVKQIDGAEQLRFSVRDEGIGMPPEVLQRLFKRYEQGSADTARMYGGTGLGLSICRRLADLMDAQLDVHSAPAQGSTFTITLTLATAPASAMGHPDETPGLLRMRPEPLPVAADARRVLVVDDNSTNRKVMARQLALIGFRSDCAEDGEEALAKWRGSRYALVITDCHMPVMDGYTLTRAIRAAEADQALPRTVVFAWTANALPEEIGKCCAAKMDELMVKPTTMAQLQTLTGKWLSGAVIAAPSSISVDDFSLSPVGLEKAPQDRPPKPQVLSCRDASRHDKKSELAALQQAAILPSLDVSVLAALVGDDPATLQDFLHEFGISAQAIGAKLLTACAAGDLAQVGAQAHKLKSSARSVGAIALAALCDEMQAAKIGGLRALAQRFQAELAAVDTAVNGWLNPI